MKKAESATNRETYICPLGRFLRPYVPPALLHTRTFPPKPTAHQKIFHTKLEQKFLATLNVTQFLRSSPLSLFQTHATQSDLTLLRRSN